MSARKSMSHHNNRLSYELVHGTDKIIVQYGTIIDVSLTEKSLQVRLNINVIYTYLDTFSIAYIQQ